jgi:hypothetical protein
MCAVRSSTLAAVRVLKSAPELAGPHRLDGQLGAKRRVGGHNRVWKRDPPNTPSLRPISASLRVDKLFPDTQGVSLRPRVS